MMLAACPTSSSALMDGCRETVHEQWCHWLVTSGAFTVKTNTWPTMQASGDGCGRLYTYETLKVVKQLVFHT